MIRPGMILVMPCVLLVLICSRVTLVMPCVLGAGDTFQYDIGDAFCTG